MSIIDPRFRTGLPAAPPAASGEAIVVPRAKPTDAVRIPTHTQAPPELQPAGAQCTVLSGVASQWARQAAEVASTVYAGIDIATQFSFSAVLGGPEFQQVAREQGIDRSRLDASTLQRIDEAMRDRFVQAARDQKVPVSPTTVKKWLEEELTLLTN